MMDYLICCLIATLAFIGCAFALFMWLGVSLWIDARKLRAWRDKLVYDPNCDNCWQASRMFGEPRGCYHQGTDTCWGEC